MDIVKEVFILIKCKFCGKTDKNYAGYCQRCYTYFYVNQYGLFTDKIQYGKLSFVDDINDKQFGMPICHICGKAYTKLQSHIHYAHNMTKKEYCDEFGLDRNIQMTTPEYNKKMRDYALQYNMDEQVKRVGQNTRFKKGVKHTYKKSYMTMKRLEEYGRTRGKYNLKYTK